MIVEIIKGVKTEISELTLCEHNITKSLISKLDSRKETLSIAYEFAVSEISYLVPDTTKLSLFNLKRS